jgi:aspartyl-tRNA(Asn)/glutamyl-tRNA(Gln) amidotransferase subunit C
MTITKETVEHVAKLARLELTADETERYTQDLSNILALVEQLNELNLDQVSVGMTIEHPPVLRKDKGVRTFTRDELLRNAPDEEEGFFRVPRILDDKS